MKDEWLENVHRIEDAGIHTHVAGIHYYRRRKQRGMRPCITLALVADPENRHDPHAVKVLHDGEQVGWLPRDINQQYQAGMVAYVELGGDDPCICMCWPHEAEEKLDLAISIRDDEYETKRERDRAIWRGMK